MSSIKGTYTHGQIILRQPVAWPEGTEVLVEPVTEETLGVREEDWPQTPEAIAQHLALMDEMEPLEMSPAEEAGWQADREAQRDYEKARFAERARQIEERFP